MGTVIFDWVVNLLVFSLPCSWYMLFHMYNDLKKKDEIIELQRKAMQQLIKDKTNGNQ
jgi:hypothetical protein